MDKESTIEEVIRQIDGLYAWGCLTIGIILYDTFAIKTRKLETMSAAVWRRLTKPASAGMLILVWSAVTHHLFANNKARASYKQGRKKYV